MTPAVNSTATVQLDQIPHVRSKLIVQPMRSCLRAVVTPAKRGAGAAQPASQTDQAQQKPPPKHVAMNWAMRFKRVFGVEIEGCARCGGKLKIISSIEEPAVIARILAHMGKTAG